jgi:5'-nucleotidase
MRVASGEQSIMRRLVFVAFLALASMGGPASAADIAGDWTLAGSDGIGSYTGTGKVSQTASGFQVDLALTYGSGQDGQFTFTGTFDGTTLTGKRSATPGLTGALGHGHAKTVKETYTLSSDGARLEGTFGSFHETLSRTSTSTSTSTGDTSATGTAKIVILHTNDVHGQFFPLQGKGGYAALVTRLRKERDAAKAAGADVLVLDAGDIFAGTPEGDLTHGKVALDLMKLVGYDAWTVGNHEFDQGVPNLKTLASDAGSIAVLGANVNDSATGKHASWLQSSLSKTVAGVPVCIVGLVTSGLAEVTTTEGSAGVTVEQEAVATDREIAAHPEAKVFILLTHVGVPGDTTLGQHVGNKVAVIVGGHTHTAITSPARVGTDGPLVVQAGKQGAFLGRVDLEVDRKTGAVKSVSGKLIPIQSGADDATDVAKLLADEAGTITQEENTVVSTLAAPGLTRKGASSTEGNLICDCMRDHAHADLAFQNKTGLRVDMAPGQVRERDIYQVMPFDDEDVVMKLTGTEVMAVLEKSLAPDIGPIPALEVSGLVLHYDATQPAGHRVVSVEIGGAALDPKKTYSVVTSTFLSEGGDGHKAFAGHTTTDDHATVKTLLDAYFKAHSKVTPQPDQRQVSN